MLAVTEDPVHPPGRVHENTLPPLPPLWLALQVNDLPAVRLGPGQDGATVSVGPPAGGVLTHEGPVAALPVPVLRDSMKQWLGWNED